MRTFRSLRTVLAVCVALVALAGCTGGTPRDTGAGFVSGDGTLTTIDPADRQPAPELTGPELGADRQFSSTSYAGKVIVVNVWASWCTPCRAEAEDLQAASVETADVARFVGLNSRDLSPANAEAFVRVQGITYPSIYDPNGTQLVKFANLPPNSIPSTVIIDQQGRVAARAIGSITETTLVNLIDDVAAGR